MISNLDQATTALKSKIMSDKTSNSSTNCSALGDATNRVENQQQPKQQPKQQSKQQQNGSLMCNTTTTTTKIKENEMRNGSPLSLKTKQSSTKENKSSPIMKEKKLLHPESTSSSTKMMDANATPAPTPAPTVKEEVVVTVESTSSSKEMKLEEEQQGKEISSKEDFSVDLEEVMVFVPMSFVDPMPAVDRMPAVDPMPTVDRMPAVDRMPVATGWIIPFDVEQKWPKKLQEMYPKSLISRRKKTLLSFDKSRNRMNFETKMLVACENRKKHLQSVRAAARYHNHHVAHARLVRQDMEESTRRHLGELYLASIEKAQTRRNLFLGERQKKLNRSSCLKSESMDSCKKRMESHKVYQRRMELAIQKHSANLKLIRRKVQLEIEHARVVVRERNNAEEVYSQKLRQQIDQKLQRADIRRSIVLDQKRLFAGRHNNYVKSVNLTNMYIEKRNHQILQHQLETASFRKEVRLEEIRSMARQHNLSVQFRSSCAYRLQDAKWLNQALKSTAAQTTAKMIRDLKHETLMKRLHDAQLHREKVLNKKNKKECFFQEMKEHYESRQKAATERRKMLILIKQFKIQDRVNEIRARKASNFVLQRKSQLDALQYQLQVANKRREAFLERRSAQCAKRNWYVKVQVQQHQENLKGQALCQLQNLQEKLNAATLRRTETQYPVFARLNSLRFIRCRNVVLLKRAALRKLISWKETATQERLTRLMHSNMLQIFEKRAHAKEVRARKKRMEIFKAQCIESASFTKSKTAEIRRAFHQVAIQASAEDSIQRSEIARLRLHYRKQQLAEKLQTKYENHQVRKQNHLNAIVRSSKWFQGKVLRAQQKKQNTISQLKDSCTQKNHLAALRRSILLTRKVQKNAQHHQQKQKQIQLHFKQKKEKLLAHSNNKMAQANRRRQAVLASKVQTAHSTPFQVNKIQRRAEDFVSGILRTALRRNLARNAQVRREEFLDTIKKNAASQVNHAKAVAESHKELEQERAETTLKQSQLRILQTSQRRDDLLLQKKIGQTRHFDNLQPFLDLQIVGYAIFPNSSVTA